MRIVDMDSRFLGEIIKRAVNGKMIRDDILKRSGNKEILLAQTQNFPLHMVIGGIEHLCQRFRIRILLHSLHILPLREELHIEIGDIVRAPEAEIIDSLAVASRNHHIIWNSLHLVIVHMGYRAVTLVPVFDYSAAETHGKCLVCSRDKPSVAAGHPYIGHFNLISVDYLLLEKPVFIAE